jgi:Holliday junction resolvase-like predicted endonuclease
LINYDYNNFDSDYVCPYCGGLLYLDTATPPNDVCINENCQLWPRDFNSLIDATETEEPRIYREIQDKEKLLIDEIRRWKPGRLARYAYKDRRELITLLFTKGIMPLIDHFIALGELLLMTNKYPSEGTIDDMDKFRLLLEDVRRWSGDQRNLEDVQNKRIVFGRTESGLKPLFFKYTKAFAEFQKEIGLVSNKELPSNESLFPYRDLEAAVIPELDFARMTDGKEILERFWITSLQLRYLLQGHYRTKSQYNYRPDVLDFSVLFGWLMQTWRKDELSLIPTEKQEKEMADMQRHFDSQCKGRYSAQKFFSTYVDSTELVPIVARTREGILMDHHTLLFFLIYLQGCPDPEEPAIKKREQVIQDMRERVGEKFENWLRQELRSRGYAGLEAAVTESYEYDIIAISEEKKTIVIADAKYRDMAPSSFTGTNLLTQELLGNHALRYEANRQQKRLDYFKENTERFARYLEPKQPWEEYDIHSFLITKQIPLAHRYKEIEILPANEFLKRVT